MLENLYRSPAAIQRVQNSWLTPTIEKYVRELADRNIKQRTQRFYASMLIRFGEYLRQNTISDLALVPQWVEPFLQAQHPLRPAYTTWRCVISGFVHHLRTHRLAPQIQPSMPNFPHADILLDYLEFLREHRGIGEKQIYRTRQSCEAFLKFVATKGEGIGDLNSISPASILQFITMEGQHYHRVTMAARCGALRRFLAHLFQRGVTQSDRSSIVIAPVIFQQEQCPRYLTREEVDTVLAAVDQQTDRGRRDYAMLMLLAVYGLRGIEVIRLRFDDIDWRKQRLYVRKRKAGNQTPYPLTESVGNAILNYLQHGRPQSEHRIVFLTLTPIPRPFSGSSTLSQNVRGYLEKANIQVPHLGSHVFRYSCAQRLMDAETPTKTISDFLGHQVPESTMRYTKIAISQLREVAIGDGEELL